MPRQSPHQRLCGFMLKKWLSLMFCLLAMLPQQICTCIHAGEAAQSDDRADASHDSDCCHSRNSDQHHEQLPTEPVAPSDDHESTCLISQPMPLPNVEKATSATNFDAGLFVSFQDSILLDSTSHVRSLNCDDAFSVSPPHVPLFVSHRNLRI